MIAFNNCANETAGAKKNGTNVSNRGSNGGVPGSADPVAGENYFENSLKPILQKNCGGCHNEPRFGGNAPMTIYDYDSMGFWIGQGTSSTDNFLMNKVQGFEPHDGGNQCSAGITSTPCREIIEWRNIEIPGGADGSGGGSGGFGNVSFLSNTGRVKGWAVDPDDPTRQVQIRVYIGGKANQGGVEIGSYSANLFGLGGTYANHYFDFQIPAQYANGQQQSMYVYVDEVVDAKLIPGSPRIFTAYTPTSAGRAYFANTIQGQLNCGSCHQWNYDTAYASLLTPTPAQGGRATTNNFYRYSSGANGHPGGNVCGGSLCNNIQTWWNTEFN